MTIHTKIAEAPSHTMPATPQLILQQTKYAIVEHVQGKPHFLTIEGDWSPHMADAYVQPTAKNLAWFVHNINPQRTPSALTISIYDPLSCPHGVADIVGAGVSKASYALIARPFDAHNQMMEGDVLVVCKPYVERDGYKHILSDQLLCRTSLRQPHKLTDKDLVSIDKSVAYQRPSWRGGHAGFALAPCVLSLAASPI